ncbi:MAG: hypothetical protein KF889_19800 [Alphaproteobacteria bacterium]|nr:hypothetical protein [Alphaproteobacteria bacterium]MCW5744308.1 hypothetical protein [Alphaproteobacteria bacterium]
MATWTWEYGEAGTGLHFTIVYDTEAGTFTVTSLEGKFDLNALWWDDGSSAGSDVKLSKQDNALNMNGSGEDWDGMMKLSNAGLGTEGEDKNSFISEGEVAVFSLADFGITGDFNVAGGGTLGVRATSVNGGDSIKLVDKDPVFDDGETEEDPDHFPEWESPSISHVTFYFDVPDGDARDIKGIVGDKGANNPDGWFTVKFDNEALGLSNDLDDWYEDALAYIYANYGNDLAAYLKGVSIKGGQQEVWYDFDNDPDDVDDPFAHLGNPWIVENKELDADHDVTVADPFTVV